MNSCVSEDIDIQFYLVSEMTIPTVARVSAPEPADSTRLVVLAGERDSGDTCRTFIFHQENHTLGNSLRHMLLMNPRVVLDTQSLILLRTRCISGYRRWKTTRHKLPSRISSHLQY